jgi:hypothetical protein
MIPKTTLALSACLLVLAACQSSTEPATDPVPVTEDSFAPGALSKYTAISDSGNPWSLGTNTLQGNGIAINGVLLRDSVSAKDGWVEAVADSLDDGGLVLRFSDNEHYYLLAMRDDAAPSPFAGNNLQIYRRTGPGQGAFTSLWVRDVVWARGTSHRVRFEADGDSLRVYMDAVRVGAVRDAPSLTGARLGVRHYGGAASWVSRYRHLAWGALR